jgi:enoyl-CoA hydratase/carnithine racemase
VTTSTATDVVRVPVVASPMPGRPPAITRADFTRIADAVAAAAGAGARAVLLHGTPGVFCAGADLRDVRSHADDLDGYLATFDRCLDTVSTAGVPVVAAVDGPAVGAGFELALCADAVVASDRAWFCFPEAGFGLPALSGTTRLAAAVGVVRAREILLSCRRVPAVEAQALGIVTSLVTEADLDESATAAAAAFPAGSPDAVAAIKAMVATAPLPRGTTRPWIDRALRPGS